jgi:5,10-methylenetetrahydrofolate reductase
MPELALGAWANPFRDPEEQIDHLLDSAVRADYVVTQVVSHHGIDSLDRFLETAARRGMTLPILVGIFYYRSGNPRTLERLANFIPVPTEALKREFSAGASPEEVCSRTLAALRERGLEKVYLSNLEPRAAEERIRRVEALL